MLLKKIDLRWFAVLTGIITILIVINNIASFLLIDKSRFDKNKFSGTHLATERDNAKYFTTFAHAGVVELSQHYVGVNKSNYLRSFGSERRATIPLEVIYFNNNDILKDGSLKTLSVLPYSDRFFLNGIQNYTSIRVSDILSSRDGWMVGADIELDGAKRKIINIKNNEIQVEGLFGNLKLPEFIKVSLNTKLVKSQSQIGLTVTAYSDTVFWQNGVWVYDNRALIYGLGVEAMPGDKIVFQDGSHRFVKFVRSNGVVELDGNKLDPYLNGSGTKILLKRMIRDKKSFITYVTPIATSDSEFIGGINGNQRVLIPKSVSKSLSANDYVMFVDGAIRRINEVGIGYMDLDLHNDSLDLDDSNDINSKLNSILTTIKGPGIKPVFIKQPSVLPITPRTFIVGNSFLYIQKTKSIIGSPNFEKSMYHQTKLKGVPELKKLPTVWATYTGLLNVLYDSVHPINRDYLIHVLGSEERRKYVEDFIALKPEYVQSSVDNFDNSNFHSWSLNSSWNFYKQLINNYEPIFSYDYMTMWRLNANPWNESSNFFSYSGTSLPYNLPSYKIGKDCKFELYTVTVEYNVKNPWKFIPILGKTDRFLVNKYGAINRLPVSLPPDEISWSFPVLRKVDSSVKISLDEVHPIAKFSKININQIKFELMKVSQDKIKKMFFPSYFSNEVICEG